MNEHQHIQPTLYAGLMFHRVDDALLQELRRIVEDECGRSGLRAFLTVEERIREAYAAGLVDGFGQGVAAESNRRDALDAASTEAAKASA